jgi:hypothetical protein
MFYPRETRMFPAKALGYERQQHGLHLSMDQKHGKLQVSGYAHTLHLQTPELEARCSEAGVRADPGRMRMVT